MKGMGLKRPSLRNSGQISFLLCSTGIATSYERNWDGSFSALTLFRGVRVWEAEVMGTPLYWILCGSRELAHTEQQSQGGCPD